MSDYSADDFREARRPIDSLLSKSEKAQRKLAPGTWQHTMLRDNIAALRIASALLDDDPDTPREFSPEELEAAVTAIASMSTRTEQSQAKFAPGTSQHTLQRNRLAALRIAESLVQAQARSAQADPREL